MSESLATSSRVDFTAAAETSAPPLDPLDVIALYGYRFKIETGFR